MVCSTASRNLIAWMIHVYDNIAARTLYKMNLLLSLQHPHSRMHTSKCYAVCGFSIIWAHCCFEHIWRVFAIVNYFFLVGLVFLCSFDSVQYDWQTWLSIQCRLCTQTARETRKVKQNQTKWISFWTFHARIIISISPIWIHKIHFVWGHLRPIAI